MITKNKIYQAIVISLIFTCGATAEVEDNKDIRAGVVETDSAKQWFVAHYAPVWKNTHSLNAQALVPLFHSQGFIRVGDELALCSIH
jgi:hypothetical protein